MVLRRWIAAICWVVVLIIFTPTEIAQAVSHKAFLNVAPDPGLLGPIWGTNAAFEGVNLFTAQLSSESGEILYKNLADDFPMDVHSLNGFAFLDQDLACDGLCWYPVAAIRMDWLLGVSLQVSTTVPTATATLTATPTTTATSTSTRTSTTTPTVTQTPTGTPSRTVYVSPTTTRTPFPTAVPATQVLTPSPTSTFTATITPTVTGTPTLLPESPPTIMYTLAVNTSTPTILPTPSPTQVPSVTPALPDQIIIELVESGNFIRTIVIILLIAVWGVFATGLFIYLNNRNP